MKKDNDIKNYDIAAILFFGIIAIGSAIGICFGKWHQALILIMSLVMVYIHLHELKQILNDTD